MTDPDNYGWDSGAVLTGGSYFVSSTDAELAYLYKEVSCF